MAEQFTSFKWLPNFSNYVLLYGSKTVRNIIQMALSRRFFADKWKKNTKQPVCKTLESHQFSQRAA